MGVHDLQHYEVIKGLLEIPEGEPIFILRAQDRLYVPILAAYEQLYLSAVFLRHGVESDQPSDAEMNFADHIAACAENGRNWQRRNKTRVKIPD